MRNGQAEQKEGFRDPRGRGFRTRTAVEEVWGLIDRRVEAVGMEEVPLREAAGRVLAGEVVAGRPMPPFDRAAMDGFALRGEETFGADGYAPAVFRVIGRSRPGNRFGGRVGPGEAVAIATGAPMPEGADAVAPVESVAVEADQLKVVEPFPPGRHVGRTGEDIEEGARMLEARRRLRPQDLGVLSGVGISRVAVLRRPRVAVVITGDELLPAGSPAQGDRIADMNSVMLGALIERDGGVVEIVGPMADDRPSLRGLLERLAREADAVLVSGGSSTGPEDHAPSLVAELGELSVHGVALRPASPTGIGFVGRTPVVLLPGNPVSCLCAYDLFGGRIVRRLAGRSARWPYRAVRRRLAGKLVSAVGRVDYARVRFDAEGQVEPIAVSGASILSSATRADGFVLIPGDLEGYAEGAEVVVWCYDTEYGGE